MKQSDKKESRFPVFQERLRRVQGELSNTEFAKKLGISRQTVGFYLNGDRLPDILTLRTIAETCGVTADWLIGLTDDPEKTPAAVDELGLSPEAIKAIKQYKGKRFLQTRNYASFYWAVKGKDIDDQLVDATSPISILDAVLENPKFWEGLYDLGYSVMNVNYCSSPTKEDFARIQDLIRELRKYNFTTTSASFRARKDLGMAFERMSNAFREYCRPLVKHDMDWSDKNGQHQTHRRPTRPQFQDHRDPGPGPGGQAAAPLPHLDAGAGHDRAADAEGRPEGRAGL